MEKSMLFNFANGKCRLSQFAKSKLYKNFKFKELNYDRDTPWIINLSGDIITPRSENQISYQLYTIRKGKNGNN